MKKLFLLKTMFLLCALIVGSINVWADEGDELAICQGTGSGYGTRRTLTDSHSVGWVLSSSQTNYLGANSATNHGKVVPTAADLPVVKAVKADATTTTTGYYFYYTTTAVENVGSLEFSYTGNSGSTTATAYVVVGDALSASGGDAYEIIELSATSTTAQNASLGSSGTFTYTFNETQTSARYYGFIIVTSSYKRLTAGTIKLLEGDTTPAGAATTTTINASGITNTDIKGGTAAGSLSATVTVTEGGAAVDGATVTWSTSDSDVATINASTGVVTLVSAGSVTFTATYAGNSTYAGSSSTYNMTVNDTRSTATLTFTPASLATMEVGDADQNLTLATDFDGTITAVSSNSSVATITSNGTNSWVISAIAKGSVTFTFTADATANYKAINTTLNMDVVASDKIVLNKKLTFLPTTCGLAGGGYTVNDSKTTLNGTFKGDSETTEFSGFAFSSTYINASKIQMAKEGVGKITFPTIVSDNGFDVLVDFATNTAKIKIDGVEVTGTDATNATLVIQTGDKYCQINSIVLIPRPTVTLNGSGFATYSSADNFTVTDADAYKMALTISNNEVTGLTGTALSGIIPAGEGILLKGTASASVTIAFTAEDATADVSGNDLKGTTPASGDAPTPDYSENNYYVLSGDTFKPYTTAASFKANKAYFEVAQGVSLARSFTMTFEDGETTGISSMHNAQCIMNNEVFDLQGRKVAQPTKGLYIVNGRKVVIR